MKLKLLDLFSGIGGFSLGLERSGYFETVAFCEIEEYPRKVLARHWPEVPCYDDIRELTAGRLAADGIAVDAICGGFPCQDISTAGKGAGIEGERSGLWSEYARLIGELRPQVVFVENVAALLSRGMGRVLGDLSEYGYDAEWAIIRASDVGAPHQRARLWLVAYPELKGLEGATRPRLYSSWRAAVQSASSSENVPNSDCFGPSRQGRPKGCGDPTPEEDWKKHRAFHDGGWSSEPDVGRVANGVPARAHRLKGLGNAVVPQIPELIGRAYGEWRAAQ